MKRASMQVVIKVHGNLVCEFHMTFKKQIIYI